LNTCSPRRVKAEGLFGFSGGLSEWKQIEQLYDAALKRDANRRAAFLDQACEGDSAEYDTNRNYEEEFGFGTINNSCLHS